MRIEIWSDFASPECYVGQVRLQHVIQRLGMQRDVDYRQDAYLIDPQAPVRSVETNAEKLAYDKGISLKQAHERYEHWKRLGATEGLNIRYGFAYNTNTMDAHRLVLWVQDEYDDPTLTQRLIDLLFKANLTNNFILADREVLEEIGQAAGLNGKEIIRMLSSNAYKKAVIAQTAHFNDLGESSLPFFIIGKKSFGGIQPRQVFADALNKDADEFVNARL